jgi:hypothetical protein
MKTWTESSGRMKRIVTPSAPRSRKSTAPEDAVSRSLPSAPTERAVVGCLETSSMARVQQAGMKAR